MYININYTIRINHINSKSINSKHNFKDKTKMETHPNKYTHEASKRHGSPPCHLSPMYVRDRHKHESHVQQQHHKDMLTKNKHT